MTDFSHLDAIQHRLRLAKERVANAKTDAARTWFQHQVIMIEREERNEYAFLGIDPATIPASVDDLTDDELLKELGA